MVEVKTGTGQDKFEQDNPKKEIVRNKIITEERGAFMNRTEEYDRSDWQEQFPAILTPTEVMDILGIGKNTVYHLLKSGTLKGLRIGRSWRITGDALEEFLLLR